MLVTFTIQVLKSAKLINCSLNRSFKNSNRIGLVLGNSLVWAKWAGMSCPNEHFACRTVASHLKVI